MGFRPGGRARKPKRTIIQDHKPMTVPQEGTPNARWLKLAWMVYLGFGAALAVKCAVEPNKHSVWPCFEQACHNWWDQRRMYDAADTPPGSRTGYRYSPTFAVLLSPLAVLPRPLGGAGWCLLNLGALYLSLRALRRSVLPGCWSPPREALFLLLALAGSARGLWAAQSNALVFALAALGAVWIARQRWWAAAFSLAGAVFIKLWPISLALLLMACLRRELIGRFCAACLVLAAVPFFATLPFAAVVAQYRGWYGFLTGVGQHRWEAYRDAWTIWEHLVGPGDAAVYALVQAATGLFALAWCRRVHRRSGPGGDWLAVTLAAWVCWQLLFGPGTERNTYGLAAPMAAWAIVVSPAGHRRNLAWGAWGMNLLFGGTGSLERLLLPFFPAAKTLVPMSTVLLAAWLAAYGRTPQPPQAVSPTGCGEAPGDRFPAAA